MNTHDKNAPAEKPLNEQTQPEIAEESLSEGHLPDVGEQETPVVQGAPATAEEAAQRDAQDWKDKYFRLYAEFDNFRKRSQRERVELLQGAGGDVISELLPVLDDFERAVKANETLEDLAAVKEGFVLIYHKMFKRMEARGLKPMDSDGSVFDVDFHEAITNVPSPTPDMKGKVVDTVEKGYLYNEKVLRFAKVVVGA